MRRASGARPIGFDARLIATAEKWHDNHPGDAGMLKEIETGEAEEGRPGRRRSAGIRVIR